MARPKKFTRSIQTVEEANAALSDLLVWQLEKERQQGAMDLARAAATARFEAPIDKAKAEIADLEGSLQVWYMANKEKLEKDGRKSVRLLTGVVGRRRGNKTLTLLNRAWTWTASLVLLRQLDRDDIWHDYKPRELDREAVVQKLTPEELAKAGLKVEQEERFFAEPDRSQVK